MKSTDCSCCIQNCEIKQHYNFETVTKQRTFQPRFLCLWLTTHGCEVWFQAQISCSLSFYVPPCLQYVTTCSLKVRIWEQSHVHAHKHMIYAYPQTHETVAWFDRCPHPIHMKCMHGGHQHQQKFPVKICSMIRLSNENALLYCNTNIYYQIQTPQELHCCLMLAQISTTHIHKQIEPVLPYFMELKPFQSQHLRICNISLQH